MASDAVLGGDGRVAAGRMLLAGWAGALVAYLAFAGWLLANPPALSSDDALFFAHGLVRFSILDLSPQFPGYPGFIAIGRLLLPFAGGDPVRALALLTSLLALALPPLAACIALRQTGSRAVALLAFVLALAMPLLPDLGLSLLSDGAGVAFLLVFLALLPRPGAEPSRLATFLAGAALAWALACRPSDAALLAGAGLGAVAVRPAMLLPLAAGAAAVGFPVAATVLALEPLYFTEGARFTAGHALIWGNTALSGEQTDSWLGAIAAVPGGLATAALIAAGVALALPRLRQRSAVLAAAVAAFGAHALWIAVFQNPDSLRHLAPLLLLGGLVALLTIGGGRLRLVLPIALLAVEVAVGVTATRLLPSPPPLQSAIGYLAGQRAGTTVATNEGVFLLRDRLQAIRVYDMHYPADAALNIAMVPGAGFRLASTALPARTPVAIFPTRFIGEHTLYLYRAACTLGSETAC